MILDDFQRFFSSAQFLVVYRYSGTFGMHKNVYFVYFFKGFRSFSIDYFWENSYIFRILPCLLHAFF
jgi:hypothetical protein